MNADPEIHRALGRVEGKIDTMLEQMKAHDDRATELAAQMRLGDADLDVRIRKVENRQHWYSGLGAAAGMIAGLLTGHGFKLPQ